MSEPTSEDKTRIVLWAQAGIALITVGVLILQYCALNKTDEKIGKELEIAARSFAIVDRPYIVFNKIEADVVNGYQRFSVACVNAGRTPAFKTTIHICEQYFTDSLIPFKTKRLPIDSIAGCKESGTSITTVASGDTIRDRLNTEAWSTMKLIGDGKIYLGIFGRVTYHSYENEKEDTLEFCVSLNRKRGEFIYCPDYNGIYRASDLTTPSPVIE